MHRLGLSPDDLDQVLDRLQAGGREVSVLCTHLACADDLDNDATREQIELFIECASGKGLPLSISNSAGILAWPDSHADWNRPGYMLYGDSPMIGDIDAARSLQPAMTLRSEIIAIREIAAGESVGYGGRWQAKRPSKIGTVACGYADGYPRHAPDGTPTLVDGRVAPLVGTVSMDMITLDLTGYEDVTVGASVELWGSGVAVSDVATRSGTIGYELLTGVTQRVPRIFRVLTSQQK
jgi:alanine racemase